MFENLSDKLDRAFKVLKGQGTITEINIPKNTNQGEHRGFAFIHVKEDSAQTVLKKYQDQKIQENTLKLEWCREKP